MQYIKHYYVDAQGGSYCCTTTEPKYKRHPVQEYAGLDVKVWLTDANGVEDINDSTARIYLNKTGESTSRFNNSVWNFYVLPTIRHTSIPKSQPIIMVEPSSLKRTKPVSPDCVSFRSRRSRSASSENASHAPI